MLPQSIRGKNWAILNFMSLSIGIVGLPNVGKSTLFKALTGQSVLIANYPFATIEPNTGVVPVPDEELDKLAKLFKPKKVIPATVQFIDIAGLVAGAHKGEGLGNKFLAHIRECDAICLVIRDFADANITHVAGTPDVKRDLETIKTELILADLATLTPKLLAWEKQSHADPRFKSAYELAKQAHGLLNSGKTLSENDFSARFVRAVEIDEQVKNLLANLLTTKPIIYVFNVDEATLTDKNRVTNLVQDMAPTPPIAISARLEAELAELTESEAKQLLQSLDIKESGLVQLIQSAYKTLGLQTFYTAGEPEVRAWTIRAGARAPEAAGKIHTDFAKGFIAAEIVNSKDLLASGSWLAARAKGLVRTEGKDYVMREADVVLFRFNL